MKRINYKNNFRTTVVIRILFYLEFTNINADVNIRYWYKTNT